MKNENNINIIELGATVSVADKKIMSDLFDKVMELPIFINKKAELQNIMAEEHKVAYKMDDFEKNIKIRYLTVKNINHVTKYCESEKQPNKKENIRWGATRPITKKITQLEWVA